MLCFSDDDRDASEVQSSCSRCFAERFELSLTTRYVLAELLKVFAITLTGMTFLMIVVGVASEAILQGLGPVPIAQLVPYVLPNALRFAVPGTMLFSACSLYGRMASANEVVAIKSLGAAPTVIIWPALILSFVLSLVTVWLNDVAVSWGREGVQRVVLRSVEEIVYGMLKTQRSYSTKGFSIKVKSVEGRTMINPTFIIHGQNGKPPITLTAKEAELICDPDNDMLTVVLRDGMIDVPGKGALEFRESFEHHVPLSEATRKGTSEPSPSQLRLSDIPTEIVTQRKTIDELEKALAADAAIQMVIGDFDGLNSGSWQHGHQKLNLAQERLHRLHTEPWRRWANGFSCFFFVLVGAPLAMRLRNSDLWTTFALCFLPILLVYYPLLAYGVDRAKSGALPPYAVWMGNAILLVIGCWMIRKVTRH